MYHREIICIITEYIVNLCVKLKSHVMHSYVYKYLFSLIYSYKCGILDTYVNI